MSYKTSLNILKRAFDNYSFELGRKLSEINRCLKAANIEGSLRISVSSHGKQTYYHYNEKANENKFIKKKDEQLRVLLAKKDFYSKAKENLEKQKSVLSQCLEVIKENDITENYENLHIARQALIQDIDLDDAAYISQWESQQSQAKNPFEIKGDFYSMKGEHVRSKSEKIIADTLYHKGVPYKYEHALPLSTGEVLYPDFTALNVRERKTYYLEHLGMMMDQSYVMKNIDKIEKYEANGIWPGEKLLFTMEGGDKGLNSRLMEKLIDKFLL